MICPNPHCQWPKLLQGLADSLDGVPMMTCVVALQLGEDMESGTFARACARATLREATTAELVAELVRRGGPEA